MASPLMPFRGVSSSRLPKAALVLATNLLGVERVLIVAHTRCAGASNTEAELRELVGRHADRDASWMSFHVIPDQVAALHEDIARVRSHPLIPESVLVGGFIYDVDTGLLHRHG